MAKLPQFQRRQYEMAAHIRDPDTNPAPPGIEDRRMAVYRNLFFNNVSTLLAKSFPVLHKILGDAAYKSLIRDYYKTHVAHTPYFQQMPQEFLLYLQEERGEQPDDPPFLLELAHYEWVELAVAILETDDAIFDGLDPAGDLLDAVPVTNPAAWSLVYGFPVHRISPEFMPTEAGEQPTYLVVYRGRNDKVGFLEINAVTARLIELLKRGDGMTGRAVLTQIATELEHPKPETVIAGGLETLQQLLRHEIVLGVINNIERGDSADG